MAFFLARALVVRHEAHDSFCPTVSNFLEIHLVIHISFLTEQSHGIYCYERLGHEFEWYFAIRNLVILILASIFAENLWRSVE